MADITVSLVGACSDSPPVYCGTAYSVTACTPITYTIRNLCSLTYALDMPVEVISIPETQVNFCDCGCTVNCEGEGPITIKVVGNTSTIDIGWTIMDEPTTVVSGGTPCLPSITTANDQVKFLHSALQNRSINYRYKITTSAFTNIEVLLTSLSATLTNRSPVAYNAHMKFTVGDNTVSVSEGDS